MCAEEHELGFDPTITRLVLPNGHEQYDITVRSSDGEEHLYRTQAVLWDGTSGDPLTGKSTRVWRAVRIVEGAETGDPVALKDCWTDQSREREGSINARIRATVQTGDVSVLSRILVTVLLHGDVLVDNLTDCTRTSPPALGAFGRHDSRVHYRIVYKEVGRSLRQEKSVETIFKALGDVSQGMCLAHSSGVLI